MWLSRICLTNEIRVSFCIFLYYCFKCNDHLPLDRRFFAYKNKINYPILSNGHPSATANKTIHGLKIGDGVANQTGTNWLSMKRCVSNILSILFHLCCIWILSLATHLSLSYNTNINWYNLTRKHLSNI